MKFEVITSEDFTESEIKEIKKSLENIGYETEITNRGMIRKSGGELPAAIWIIFKVVAIGFFTKLGADAWTKLKNTLNELRVSKEEKPTQIRLYFEYGGYGVGIYLPENSKNFKRALELLPEYIKKYPELNTAIRFHEGSWGTLEDHMPQFKDRK